MRVCSVVRNPPRASSTATAVPNDPAPTTTARRLPGVGSARCGRGGIPDPGERALRRAGVRFAAVAPSGGAQGRGVSHAQTRAAAGAVLAAVVALGGAPAALAHPEECASSTGGPRRRGSTRPTCRGAGAEEGLCTAEAVERNYDDSKAQLAAGESRGADLRLLSLDAEAGTFAPETAFNSDLAFKDGYAFQGNYEGFSIWDVAPPAAAAARHPDPLPRLAERRDVSTTASSSPRPTRGAATTAARASRRPPQPGPTTWEGLKVFDISRPARAALPQVRARPTAARTPTPCCPSGNAAARLRVLLRHRDRPLECERPHDKISVVEIPRSDPGGARVMSEPVLFPDGGYDGAAGTQRATDRLPRHHRVPGAQPGRGRLHGRGGDHRHLRPGATRTCCQDQSRPELRVLAQRHDQPRRQAGAVHRREGRRRGRRVQPDGRPAAGADAIYDITRPAQPAVLELLQDPADPDQRGELRRPQRQPGAGPRDGTSWSSPGTRAASR